MVLFNSSKALSVGFSSMSTLSCLFILLSCLASKSYACNQDDLDSLLSFYQHISSPPAAPLNWSSANCCNWEGINCDDNDRINYLWLSRRGLSGSISKSLGNLSSLSYLNLSHNRLSGSLPGELFPSFNRLEVLDLSYNSLAGAVLEPTLSLDSWPISIQSLDLSSNHFNGSIGFPLFQQAPNLVTFNISNNSFTGPIPSSICSNASSIKVLDFSMNKFTGLVSHALRGCFNLEIFRAGFNILSGLLPYDLFNVKTLKEISLPSSRLSGPISNSIVQLSNLSILELHDNQLVGELPKDIGLLSNLEKLLLHTNNLTGSLPPSLMLCTKLKILLLRNNMLQGEVSTLDFSKLQLLHSIDLGNNSFKGNFPATLCRCSTLNAIRLAYNQLEGQLPSCMAQLKSLSHLSLTDNNLANATGALRILLACKNLNVLFMSRTFHNETLPDDNSMSDVDGFQNLEILTLGGGRFTGEIPNWIAKLRKLKALNLSLNKISGLIPSWLGRMPNLFVIDFNDNQLCGQIPQELGNLTALRAEKASADFSYLALPFLSSSLEYNRLYNLPRGLKLGNNDLSGSIPAEIGRLKQLQVLDLSDNNLSGSIPEELSNLINLEKLNLSRNQLTGEIPASLTSLNFLSSFSVAKNDLEGEIPRRGQFDTFPASSYEGNPKLCGYVIRKNCAPVVTQTEVTSEEENDNPWFNNPIWLGFLVGFAGACLTLVFHSSWRHAYFDFLNSLKDKIISVISS